MQRRAEIEAMLGAPIEVLAIVVDRLPRGRFG
jgi:hypothetical protein